MTRKTPRTRIANNRTSTLLRGHLGLRVWRENSSELDVHPIGKIAKIAQRAPLVSFFRFSSSRVLVSLLHRYSLCQAVVFIVSCSSTFAAKGEIGWFR